MIDTDSLPEGNVAGYYDEQLLNAAYIINAGAALNLDARDQKIGVMTAMGESALRVLDTGDAAGPDSRGLFQQRDNGAWGSLEDRMDPTISATNFFLALMEVDEEEAIGDEDVVARQMSLIAHAVQVNADPYHYESYWDEAEEVFNALAGIDLPGVPDNYAASQSCAAISGGGAPQISDQCAPVAHARLETSTCRGYAAIQTEFGINWPGGVGCYHPRPWEIPPMDHPKGLACDYMVATAAQGKIPTPEMHQQAIEVINWLIQHHEVLKIKYIIYEGHIWNPGYGDPVGSWETVKRWNPLYATGDLTTDHYDHIHVSHHP
ncbi:hypothetical protein KIK06_17540 [Nocardiopsis sp. EMB25]|uniref:hypothetical protein n=1 Tax=Nocardiopsis sp. EMB25 TaxID=2835867 RepID=UPI0022836AFF|nr:hypothetical protein [Nocardiopsis sp. EMB25]MCY9785692.1 hypothetical protein [Nocardiopsis sp. EMB25]